MPAADSARSALNTNDLRGKVLRIHVKDADIAPADSNKADLGSGGAYTDPGRQPVPARRAAQPQAKTRPEVYAMGFRNPFRIQVDENDVAYVSDYSPDSQTPQQFHGTPGTGRFEIVRKPGELRLAVLLQARPAGVPLERQPPGADGPDRPSAVPAGQTPQPYDCGDADGVPNNDYWNVNGGPSVEPGLTPTRRRSPRRTSGTRTATTTRRPRSARRASRFYGPTR